jgi:hypothetical protein
MKKILIYIFFCITGITHAQDQLFKKDNTRLEVKILEINQTEIKYKLFTYQDGPTIIISKKDVALIIYQNGVHEVITTEPATEKPTIVYYANPAPERPVISPYRDSALFRQLTSTRHLISLNILDPLNSCIGISYFTEFANNYLNLYVPVSVGFGSPYFSQSSNNVFGIYNYGYAYNGYYISDYKFTNKTIDAGLGLHFQTSGKHPVTHFIGPYVGMAQFTGTYRENSSTYDQYGYANYTLVDRSFVLNRVYVLLDNGFLFRVTKNFNIMMLAGVGYHVDTYISKHGPTNSSITQFPVNAFKFGLSFGYRF